MKAIIMKNVGCVYFFRHIGLTPVKIGYTENQSPIDRFTQFKTYAPYGSEILGFIQTSEAKELESALHRKYESKRLNGEWFEITEIEVQSEIDFYTPIELVRERNEFQQAWAKSLKEIKEVVKKEVSITHEISKKDAFIKLYKENKKLNRTKTAEKIGVSRMSISTWIREIEKH